MEVRIVIAVAVAKGYKICESGYWSFYPAGTSSGDRIAEDRVGIFAARGKRPG